MEADYGHLHVHRDPRRPVSAQFGTEIDLQCVTRLCIDLQHTGLVLGNSSYLTVSDTGYPEQADDEWANRETGVTSH